VLTLAAVMALAVLPTLPVFVQLGALAILLAMVGIPHGAADHLALRRVLRGRFGRGWPAVFALGYVGLASFTLWSWLAAPPLLLTLFLGLAVMHFGSEDAFETLYPVTWVRRLAIPLHGLIPVAGPALFHPAETATLFAWLLPGTPPESVLAVLQGATSAVPLLVGSWTLLVLLHLSRWQAPNLRAAAEVATLVLLVSLAPPLLGFAIYFCGWHAVRHILVEGHALEPRRPRHGIALFLQHAMPMTIATIVLGVMGYMLVAAGARPDVTLTRVIFIGLAAVAVPHIVIRALVGPAKSDADGRHTKRSPA
jgi:Brp/Blh family beta-carotene 15,15'-monooxygenase